ncbi:MAG: hypothetical protein FWD05_12345 [Oscillospiraceae bacterium]|nr:hypothetical protein [Oscillospiraceae bacterium]
MLGILAGSLPIPVVDIILGVIGIILAVAAKDEGFVEEYVGQIRKAGLISSIIGTIIAVWFTFSVFAGFSIFSMIW